jgi:hypothetical protein
VALVFHNQEVFSKMTENFAINAVITSYPNQPGWPLWPISNEVRAGPTGIPAGLAAFLGGLSLNRILFWKHSLLPTLRKSRKYET